MDGFRAFGGEADNAAEEIAMEAPPGIDHDRRAHAAAYEHWVSLLDGRPCPSIFDLDRCRLEGSCAILLELIDGEPRLVFAGSALLQEAGLKDVPGIGDVPANSFLSLLIAHFPQAVSTREPIAFEGEHGGVNGPSSIYRGILLPLSSDGCSVDHVYGSISWRELADSGLTADIVLEVGRAIAEAAERAVHARANGSLSFATDRSQRELPLHA